MCIPPLQVKGRPEVKKKTNTKKGDKIYKIQGNSGKDVFSAV